jgi:hypothetical protein
MIRLELSAADLLRCRFAISPVGEVFQAAHAIANPSARAAHTGWRREHVGILLMPSAFIYPRVTAILDTPPNRHVMYSRTPLGEALLAGAADTATPGPAPALR